MVLDYLEEYGSQVSQPFSLFSGEEMSGGNFVLNQAWPQTIGVGEDRGYEGRFDEPFTVRIRERDSLSELLVAITGIEEEAALDLRDILVKREEKPYAITMLRSAANAERWYDELREYLADYGVEVTKKFEPQDSALAAKGTTLLRKHYLSSATPTIRELRMYVNGR